MTKSRHPETLRLNLAKSGFPEIPLLGQAYMMAARQPLREHVHKGLMEIHYLKMGEQVFSVKGKKYKLKSGDLFVTWPEDRHSTGKTPHGKNIWFWTQFCLPERPTNFMGMSARVVWPLVQKLWRLPCRHFCANKRIETLYEEIFSLAREKNTENFQTEFSCRFILWLLTVVECSQRQNVTVTTNDIGSIIDMIETDPSENFTVEYLAELAALSVSRFKAKFKEQTGLPPHEFIMRTKIRHAHELLRTTNKSVTNIAYELGFSSSQYFATVFRRFFNISPSEIKKH